MTRIVQGVDDIREDCGSMKLYMVEIRVRDWPHTFHWYRDVLGLPVIFVDEPNRFVMLSAGRVRLALKAGSPTDPVHESVNLVFEVSDVDATRKMLTAKGVVTEPPFDSPLNEGYREMRFKDPEGAQIRVFSWLEN